MYRLVIQTEAVEDLMQMQQAGGNKRKYASRIVAILQEMKVDQVLLKDLATDRFSTDDFDVGKYLEFWNDGIDLWKIKIYDFNRVNQAWWVIPYRVLYAYDIQALTFRVLGVVHRSFNYEPEHELTKRIISSYNDLGLPRHKIIRSPASGRNKPH